MSGGEDRTVRIWRGIYLDNLLSGPPQLFHLDGECIQTLVHPAISVWAVSSMPNGDIVSGCSDGVVRVFSASKERWASETDLKEYNEKVANTALPSQQVGDIKKSDLPGPEALHSIGMTLNKSPSLKSNTFAGKKPGEVKMINNGSIVEAHQVVFHYICSPIWTVIIVGFSGTVLPTHGRRLEMLSTLSVKDASNYTKARSTTMSSMLIFKMEFLR